MSGKRRHTLRGNLWGLCILLPVISPLSCFAHFSQAKELVYKIKEGLPSGVAIGAVGTDLRLDFSVDPPLLFNLALKKIGKQYVNLNSSTGELRTSGSVIDRETLCRGESERRDCSLALDVLVLPQQYFQLVKVKVVVEDVNDNEPRFPADEIRLFVPEDAPVNSRFALEQSATDPDAGSNGVQTYWLGDDFGAFTLDVEESEGGELTPILIVTAPLDRETRAEYETSVIAEDGGVPPLLGTAVLKILVTDVNDNCPRFLETQVNITLFGNATKGSHLARLRAHDPDQGANGQITYAYSERVPRDARGLFHLDRVTGIVRLAGEIDGGAAKTYRLTVLAVGPACIPAVAVVTARIVAVGSGPVAIVPRYIAPERDGAVWLRESEPASSPVAFFTVENAERRQKTECHLEGEGPFRLAPYKPLANEYLLETAGALDYELRREYELAVVARIGRGGPIIRTPVRIRVTDENDNAPVFERGLPLDLFLEENSPPDAFLVKLQATDEDSGSRGEVIYLLGSDAPPVFSLDRETGVLTASASLDREEKERYRFTVRALDRGSPRQETAAMVTVTVLDRNDNSPRFVNKDFTFFVPENFPGFGEIGVLSVTDADAGQNGWVALSILNGSDAFVVDAGKGALRARTPLDREQQGAYFLWVEAADGGEPSLSCVTMVTVLLLDVNDNPPLVLFPQSNRSYMLVLPGTQPGTSVTEVYAVDRDTGMNAVIAYSIVRGKGGEPASFDIDPDTGNITLRRSLHRGLHRLLVRVSDHGQPEPLHATVLVNLFVNETLGNETYVRGLLEEEEAAEAEIEGPLFDRVVDSEGSGRAEAFPCRLPLVALSVACLGLLLIAALLAAYICCRLRATETRERKEARRRKGAGLRLKMDADFQDVDRKLMEISNI